MATTPSPKATRRPREARAVAASAADQVLRDAAERLRSRAGSRAEARLEAELLLAFALGLSRGRLHTVDDVDAEAATRFEALVVRRERDAEPVSHLLGSRAFYDLDVDVDRRVLTPRPETETLIEVFAELAEGGALPSGPVADWGTGSGVLAAVLRRWRPVLALERSPDAREVASGNLGRDGSGLGWLLVASDGLRPVAPGSLAAVVANPPYIEPSDWDELPEDVRRHEPRQALLPDDGDVTGLYARLGGEATRCLVPGGYLLAEVGAGQAQRLERALASGGLVPTERRRDLLGHERVLVLRRN